MCCDAEDLSKDFTSSEMYQVIDKHANELLLFVSVPPPPPTLSKQPRLQQLRGVDNSNVTTNGNVLGDVFERSFVKEKLFSSMETNCVDMVIKIITTLMSIVP